MEVKGSSSLRRSGKLPGTRSLPRRSGPVHRDLNGDLRQLELALSHSSNSANMGRTTTRRRSLDQIELALRGLESQVPTFPAYAQLVRVTKR
jgi:hypothetical protein